MFNIVVEIWILVGIHFYMLYYYYYYYNHDLHLINVDLFNCI